MEAVTSCSCEPQRIVGGCAICNDTCEMCHGTKLITRENYDGNGSDADDQPCPLCREEE